MDPKLMMNNLLLDMFIFSVHKKEHPAEVSKADKSIEINIDSSSSPKQIPIGRLGCLREDCAFKAASAHASILSPEFMVKDWSKFNGGNGHPREGNLCE